MFAFRITLEGSVEEVLSKLRAKGFAQIFRKDAVFSRDHLILIFKISELKFEKGKGIARTLENELLVRLSGEREVRKALRKVGATGEEGVLLTSLSREMLESLGIKVRKLEKNENALKYLGVERNFELMKGIVKKAEVQALLELSNLPDLK